MISIVKSSANTLVLTLEEKRTITVGKFLFQFTNDQTGVSDYCVATDTSIYPERYNKFVITETSSPNALLGQVELSTGFGKYYIYEQASSTNLNPAGLTVVEEGKYLVTTTLPTDYSHTPTLTEVVYEG